MMPLHEETHGDESQIDCPWCGNHVHLEYGDGEVEVDNTIDCPHCENDFKITSVTHSISVTAVPVTPS